MRASLRQGSEDHILAGGRRGGKKIPEEWVWVFQEHLLVLARNPAMGKNHWRLLAYLMSCATFAQDVQVKQRTAARVLGINYRTVSRVLGELCLMDVIERVDTHEYPLTYRLSSLYIYKGRGEQLPQRREYQRKEKVHGQTRT